MSPDQITLINKNLIELNEANKKRISELMKENGVFANENKVLKQYADGNLSKEDLDRVIAQSLSF